MTNDRRKGNERRNNDRFKVSMDIVWEGAVGIRRGTMSDLSLKGCFVLSEGEVHDGETVKLYLQLTNGEKTGIWALVTNHTADVGFAARFIEVSAEQRDLLLSFISASSSD